MEIRFGNVDEGTITTECEASMLYVRYQSRGHNVQIDINIVCKHTRCCNCQCSILIGLVFIINCYNLIFYRCYSNGNGNDFAVS